MRKFALLAIVAGAMIVACGPKDKLAGTWEAKQADLGSGKGDVALTFANGKDITMDMTMSLPVGAIGIKSTGTYKVENDVMTTTFTDLQIDSSKLKKEVQDQINKMMDKKMMLDSMNKGGTKIAMKGDDEITMTAGSAPAVTLKRKA